MFTMISDDEASSKHELELELTQEFEIWDFNLQSQ